MVEERPAGGEGRATTLSTSIVADSGEGMRSLNGSFLELHNVDADLCLEGGDWYGRLNLRFGFGGLLERSSTWQLPSIKCTSERGSRDFFV